MLLDKSNGDSDNEDSESENNESDDENYACKYMEESNRLRNAKYDFEESEHDTRHHTMVQRTTNQQIEVISSVEDRLKYRDIKDSGEYEVVKEKQGL